MTTVAEDNPKAAFLIAMPPKSREQPYSFPRIALLTLASYLIMLSVKQEGIKYHFLSLKYDSTWDWTPVYRTIDEHLTYLANVAIYIYIYIYKELEKLEITGRVETIQITALLRSARILRRVMETWEELLSLKPLWKTIS